MEPHHQGLRISEAAAPHPQQCSRGYLCLVGLLVGTTSQPPTFGPQRGTAGHREKAKRVLAGRFRQEHTEAAETTQPWCPPSIALQAF